MVTAHVLVADHTTFCTVTIVRLQERTHSVLSSNNRMSVSNVISVMSSMLITSANNSNSMITQRTTILIILPLVSTSRTVKSAMPLSAPCVRRVIDNNISQESVSYPPPTAPKDVPHAPLMNVSAVKLDIPHNHGQYVLTAPTCSVETPRVNARPFKGIAQPIKIAPHVSRVNVPTARKVMP